jgi:predicted nucleic acid-binding protein
MTLLDTNVLIYASDPRSEHCRWARRTISEAVAGDGAAVNAVSLAELCVGDADPATVADRIRAWGVQILDIPTALPRLAPERMLITGSVVRKVQAKARPSSHCLIFSSAPMPSSWVGR